MVKETNSLLDAKQTNEGDGVYNVIGEGYRDSYQIVNLSNMRKIILKIGDNVELWNGSFGEVVGLESPMITITNPNTYPQTFHKMNIKTINGVEYDGRDVSF